MWWISKHDVFLFQTQNCWYWDEPWGEAVIFKKKDMLTYKTTKRKFHV
jgi:hypothetical protein